MFSIVAILALGFVVHSVLADTSNSGTDQCPTAPTGLKTIRNSTTTATIYWSKPTLSGSHDVVGYRIESKLAGTALYADVISDTKSNSTKFIQNIGLISGKSYVYRISALNTKCTTPPTSDEQLLSSTISTNLSSIPASTQQTKTVPESPSGLTTISVSGTQVSLTWNAPANVGGSPIIGYKIESKKGTDSYTIIVKNTNNTITSYSNSGLTPSATYTYRVSAINSVGVGNPSGEASVIAKDNDKPILTATAISPTSIYLSWIAPSQTYHQSINGFKLEEKQGDSYKLIKDNIGTVNGYLVTNVLTGKSYTYVVSAVFSAGASPKSNEASATPLITSVTPPGISTTPSQISVGLSTNDPNSISKSQQDEMQRKIQQAKEAMSKLSGKTDSEKAVAARLAAQKANDIATKNATEAIKKRIAESQARKQAPNNAVPTTSVKLVNSTKYKPKTVEEARQLAEQAKQKALAQQDSSDSSKQKQSQKDKARQQMEAQKAAVWEKAKKALEAMKNNPKK